MHISNIVCITDVLSEDSGIIIAHPIGHPEKRKGTSALSEALGQKSSNATTSGLYEVDLGTSASELRQNSDAENAKTG